MYITAKASDEGFDSTYEVSVSFTAISAADALLEAAADTGETSFGLFIDPALIAG
jgi:hypothetical protein